MSLKPLWRMDRVHKYTEIKYCTNTAGSNETFTIFFLQLQYDLMRNGPIQVN